MDTYNMLATHNLGNCNTSHRLCWSMYR